MKIRSSWVFGAILTLASPLALAQGSGHTGGGDTACEKRIHEIRLDLLEWILSRDLPRPDFSGSPGVDRRRYEAELSRVLQTGQVIVSCKSPTRWNPEPIRIRGQAKTCAWTELNTDANIRGKIVCNTDRFLKTSEADQYSLVHHEFAALANLERGMGADSRYELSSQITSFLQLTTVLRLAPARKFDLGKLKWASDAELPVRLFKNLLLGRWREYSASKRGPTVSREIQVRSAARGAALRHLQKHQTQTLTLKLLDGPSPFTGTTRAQVFDADTSILLFEITFSERYWSPDYGDISFQYLLELNILEGSKEIARFRED